MLSKKKEDGLEREKRRADTSFRWVNNQRLRLPRHTYGTTSNGRREKRQMNGDRRTWLRRGEVMSRLSHGLREGLDRVLELVAVVVAD